MFANALAIIMFAKNSAEIGVLCSILGKTILTNALVFMLFAKNSAEIRVLYSILGKTIRTNALPVTALT